MARERVLIGFEAERTARLERLRHLAQRAVFQGPTNNGYATVADLQNRDFWSEVQQLKKRVKLLEGQIVRGAAVGQKPEVGTRSIDMADDEDEA